MRAVGVTAAQFHNDSANAAMSGHLRRSTTHTPYVSSLGSCTAISNSTLYQTREPLRAIGKKFELFALAVAPLRQDHQLRLAAAPALSTICDVCAFERLLMARTVVCPAANIRRIVVNFGDRAD